MSATLTNLLTELAKVIAAGTAFIFEPGQGQSRSLYIHHLPDPHPNWTVDGVVRIVGGAAKVFDPLDRLNVQVMVRGADQGNAWDGAWSIYTVFNDANSLPKRRISLGADWIALELDITAPQSIGLDEAGRHLIVMTLNITAGTLTA